MMPTIAELTQRVPQLGRLEWIGVSPGHRQPIVAVNAMEVAAGTGLADDYHARRGGSNRQVTLIQSEHLTVIAQLLGGSDVRPETLRRNLVVAGINLLALRKQRFQCGAVILEGTGHCHPCSRMEETLGPGGYAAMMGHGGITARVLHGGRLHIGDPIRLLVRTED